jgi:serine/threonine protein kinase
LRKLSPRSDLATGEEGHASPRPPLEWSNLDRQTLRSLLEGYPSGMPLLDGCKTFQQILVALDEAHKEGPIHCGINPLRVVFEQGHAKLIEAELGTQSPASDDSPDYLYMAPEQFLAPAHAETAADIYSSGIIFFELLTGRPPFTGRDRSSLAQAHLYAAPPDLQAFLGNLPIGISKAVAIALDKEPEARYPTPLAFLDAVRGGMAGFLPDISTYAGQSVREFCTEPELNTGTSAPVANEPAPSEPASWRAAVSVSAVGIGVLACYGLWYAWHRHVPSVPKPEVRIPSDQTRPKELRSEPTASIPAPKVSSEQVELPTPTETQKNAPRLKPPTRRNTELERIRSKIYRELTEAADDLNARRFEATRQLLDRISGKVALYPNDLQPEGQQAQSLRNELQEAIVAEKTAEREKQLQAKEVQMQAAAWEGRLQEIRNYLEQKKFPEAQSAADELMKASGVPMTVASQASQLGREALEGLKRSWQDTSLGPTENTIQRTKPPLA